MVEKRSGDWFIYSIRTFISRMRWLWRKFRKQRRQDDPGRDLGITISWQDCSRSQMNGAKKTVMDVEFQVTDWDSYWTMLEAGVQGGEMPDVFWMHSNNALKYMQAGAMLNLDDYIENDDTMNIDDFYPDITNLYTLDALTMRFPKDHDTIAVIYNKAIFDKYGIEYPTSDWTWQDFC